MSNHRLGMLLADAMILLALAALAAVGRPETVGAGPRFQWIEVVGSASMHSTRGGNPFTDFPTQDGQTLVTCLNTAGKKRLFFIGVKSGVAPDLQGWSSNEACLARTFVNGAGGSTRRFAPAQPWY